MSLKYAYIRKRRFKEIKYDLLALKLISHLAGIQTQISMTNIESTYGINQNLSYWLTRGIYKIVLKEEFSWIQRITSQGFKDLCWRKMKEGAKIVWKGLWIASYHSNIRFLFLYLAICTLLLAAGIHCFYPILWISAREYICICFFLVGRLIAVKNKVPHVPMTIFTSPFLLLHGTFKISYYFVFAFQLLPSPSQHLS